MAEISRVAVFGKLNPLAKPLALDITGKVRDLELPPLTPYSVKYAGHGIERGKLSMDVNYKVLPNGQLTASNRLVLNQLTFGEPVEGAPNSLPVKLAVALLADRQGLIDLDLPISGSLNDPQFRVGPVIFKIIINLIGKALTSPFSLLASAFGGGVEMSSVAFAPGSATLSPEAQQNLGKVAKALVDRPALKLTVTGTANLEAEREGLQRERLQQLVRAEKRRAQPDSTEPVTADEYPALLKAAYGRANIPKPRNLVGIAKDLTVPEMEALLMANQPATEAMAAELAAQRGHAIQSYLAAQKLPAERLFLDPAGGLRVTGVAQSSYFVKEALDHLGVRAEILRVGEYKSTPETFLRSGPSEPARAQRQVTSLLRDRHRLGQGAEDFD